MSEQTNEWRTTAFGKGRRPVEKYLNSNLECLPK